MKINEKISKFKKSGFGRRQVILSGLILLIAIAGYINLNYTGVKPQEDVITEALPEEVAVPVATTPVVDEFAQMKIERDKSKSESMAVFREIVDNEKTSTEAREKAQADLSAAAKTAETEKMIEALLEAKDFKETIVYIAADKVNVIVKTDGLVPTEIARIKDIVIENTGFNADSVKIVEKN